MGMVIGTNIASLTAQRHLESSRGDMETSMERLSSGQRINSASDDAAGLAIANKLEVKVMSLNQGIRNANDGISMIQVAEGGMEEIGNILGRMKELAVQASNGTYTQTSLDTMNDEYKGLYNEITRIATNTDFNGTNVLSSTGDADIHVGGTSTDKIEIKFQDMKASNLGSGALAVQHTGTVGLSGAGGGAATEITTHTFAAAPIVDGSTSNPPYVETFEITVADKDYSQAFVTDVNSTMQLLANQITAGGDATATITGIGTGVLGGALIVTSPGTVSVAQSALTIERSNTTFIDSTDIKTAAHAKTAMAGIDEAIATVDSYRATLGSTSKTLDHTVSNLMNRVESQSAALSRIKDADYAVESANLAKAQVLQQAGTAMLAQANASGQSVLSLLK